MDTRAIKVSEKYHQKLKELATITGKTITEIADEIFEKYFSQETENYIRQTADMFDTILKRIQDIEREVFSIRTTTEATNSIVKANTKPQPQQTPTSIDINKIYEAIYAFFETHAQNYIIAENIKKQTLQAYKNTLERLKKSV